VFAAHPQLLTQLLRIVHRGIAQVLLKQAGLKRGAADTGAGAFARPRRLICASATTVLR
jgi:hypothetical protein